MSKTGILTLAFYNNFGSVLQSFALKKVIYDITGETADILPFRPDLPEYQYFKSSELRKAYEVKCGLFDAFRRQYLGLQGDWFRETGDIKETYDNYITGSDIVWGKEFSNLHPAYFLGFVPEGRKRISYAASMVTPETGSAQEQIFKQYIPDLDNISLREESSIAYIQQFTEKEVTAVLDPTLLLENGDYSVIMKEADQIPDKPYLLSYFLTHDPAVVDYTNMLAKKLGLKVVHYFADYPEKIFAPSSGCFAFSGPQEFLGYVKNAACIFTNSYHGTCFSIIFHKPFYTYTAKRAMLSRVECLTGKLELKDRCFTDFRDMEKVSMEIDYTKPDRLLQRERKKSFRFLASALGGMRNV